MARPNPGKTTMQQPQESAQVNPESQQPPTSENNPPPLEDAPIHASTPWPGAGKMSDNLFEIRKDWPVPPSTNTSTNVTTKPKLPTIKVEPQDPNQSNPSSTVTKLERCGWGPNFQICKMQERIGMENIRSNFNSLVYSKSTHTKAETQDRTPSTTKTTKYHKASTPKHLSMCLTNM